MPDDLIFILDSNDYDLCPSSESRNNVITKHIILLPPQQNCNHLALQEMNGILDAEAPGQLPPLNPTTGIVKYFNILIDLAGLCENIFFFAFNIFL